MVQSEEYDPYEVAKQLYPDLPQGFPYDNFDLEELILPPGDDMGIKSDDDDVRDEDVQTQSGFGSCIVIQNLPKAPEEKYEKLMGVVRTIASKLGDVRENGIFMPLDDATKTTKGFAFVEMARKEDADAALSDERFINGYQLDKNHKLTLSRFDDFDKYAKVPDEYVQPEPVAYKQPENLHSWLADKYGRDQYVIRHGDNTAVCFNDGKRSRAEVAYQREYWTESFVQWSPQGTMLATMHRQGMAVWGGPNFTRINRFGHQNVRLIDFSPNEKYILSYTSHEPATARDSFHVLINVWDVRSGKQLRKFEGPVDEYAVGSSAGPNGALKWPVFKWAGGRDDLFFARLGRGKISIYECPSMTMLGKESLKLDGVQDFEWSPVEPVLAAYSAEQGNQPARIVLIKVPEKTEMRQKNMLNVSDVKLFWHPQGTYLAVKVEAWTKTKKSTITSFQIFCVKDKDVPLEVFELKNNKERVLNFAWEPKGHRFAVVHGDGPRPNISFFSMRDDKGRLGVRELKMLESRACNAISWSPQGRIIVLAGLKNFNGQLEFFNVDEMETMATAEHFMATDVEWDPTGRYVATVVSHVQQMENGVKIWSFGGRELYSSQRDKLYQFSWRPRMPSLLPAEKEAEIAKNLKQYTKRYDEEDEQLLQQADADVLQERQRALDEWKAYCESRRNYAALQMDFKRELYGPRFAEKEYTIQKVMVEQVVDQKEEPYSTK
ncbi:hypothetical protein CHLRE_03g190100v5 [Chlamydomonas reinhardtii]|uniref:Eukaryotic translation initiation factor 3 subunit B n=1 Tax=Chlamydomonas reinhardtii TaxID=3055 RepID=A8IRV6_CHLRE|nr:uncharacterized protein CHLRE_03g190100v5 [Chlamydomonas reinhardtii]PNW85513.1 hypothetical protein CHLRE_03g190100v5 [Chlamydomonas reinhardtii]|eukprot:XP_001691870.1 eukaryotic initiation factor [Chlamydomonas reinhardtii]